MLTVRLSKGLEKKLDNLAKRTGRTKSFYVRKAIEDNFDDLEDVYLADKSWEEVMKGGRLYTHEEIKSMFKLD